MTIFGMIFCAAIGYGSGLPAWMFHCQVPPPDYAFHPEVRGITWVDLVFPFFIFSMGAAFPFAMRKKLERGQKVIPGIFRRWITLVLFALAIGNAQAARGADIPAWAALLLSIAVWAGFFAALVRTDKKWISLAGILLLVALFAVERFVLGVKLSLQTSDIIIMILSTVALTGSLIWLLTRDNVKLRWLTWGVLLALKAADSYTGILEWAELPSPVNCIISLDWLQYLLIAIPASCIGDSLFAATKQSRTTDKRQPLADAIRLSAVIIQLWFLFRREILSDIIVTSVLAAAYVLLTYKERTISVRCAYLGLAFILAGILFDPADGGIAKDYCNLSYLLVCGGMASICCSALIAAESRGAKFGFLATCGQNPMIAYTIVWFVIEPVLYGVGLMGLVDGLAAGSVIWGLLRGVLLTSLMCLCTCFFSKRKLFWRS